MDFLRFNFRVLACAGAGLLASCIDGREEIWLQADGSGRADIAYSLPAAAARLKGGEAGIRRMIDEFLKQTPALSSPFCEVATVGGRLHIRVRAGFESALELKEISSGSGMNKLPASATGLSGKFQVTVDGLTVNFARTIDAGSSLPGAGLLPASQFQDRKLTYIIHLPEPASDSNATRVENSGRTLVWDFPLAVAIQGPVVTHFRAALPIPRWALATGGVSAALILAWVGRKLFRRKPVAA